MRGTRLAAGRLLRCRPGGDCGLDPVPPARMGSPRGAAVRRLFGIAALVAAGVAAAAVAQAPAGEASDDPLRFHDDLIDVRVTPYGGAFSSARLLNPQFHRKEPANEPFVPAEKQQAGPLDLVTTWDDDYLPLQLAWTRMQPDPPVRRVVAASVAAVFEEKASAWTLRLQPPEGTKAPRVAAGDRILDQAGAALATVTKVGPGGLHELTAVAEGLDAGKERPVRIVREGPFTQVYESDPRFVVAPSPKGTLRLVWPDPAADTSPLHVERLYRLRGRYAMDHIVRLHWRGEGSLQFAADHVLYGWAGSKGEQPSMLNPAPDVIQPACGVGQSVEHADTDLPGFTQFDGADWAGVEHRYFLLAVASASAGRGDGGQQCLIRIEPRAPLLFARLHPVASSLIPQGGATCRPAWLPGEGTTCQDLLADLSLDEFATAEAALRAKGSIDLQARASLKDLLSSDLRTVVYVGPKGIKSLEQAGHGFEAALDFGILSAICKPLLWLLHFFYGLIPQWGVAITLLTIVVKVVLLYWTYKSYVSMREMQRLRPEMEALKEKFGDDKQRFNTKMMALYKRHGVNPLGGCLPMLIQMPIYFALYRTIYATPALYQAPLFGWITDLSAPDPYFVLPVILGLVMIVQQKLTPTAMDSAQQKMMMWIMPIMFTGMMLFLPSALVFYILVNSVLSVAQQTWIYRRSPTAPAKPSPSRKAVSRGARP